MWPLHGARLNEVSVTLKAPAEKAPLRRFVVAETFAAKQTFVEADCHRRDRSPRCRLE